MPIEPGGVASVIRLLSPERLRALTILTGSDDAAIELHQETLRLGSSLMHLTATVEIALRNSVCENLSHHFCVPNWLTQTPVLFQWREPERKKIEQALDSARRAEYSKMSQADKAALDVLAYPNGRPPNTSHLKRSKDRRKRINVSEGKVIAELTLYFWKRLYGPEYDQTLWRTTLKRTFPYKNSPAPRSPFTWNKSINLEIGSPIMSPCSTNGSTTRWRPLSLWFNALRQPHRAAICH